MSRTNSQASSRSSTKSTVCPSPWLLACQYYPSGPLCVRSLFCSFVPFLLVLSFRLCCPFGPLCFFCFFSPPLRTLKADLHSCLGLLRSILLPRWGPPPTLQRIWGHSRTHRRGLSGEVHHPGRPIPIHFFLSSCLLHVTSCASRITSSSLPFYTIVPFI